MAGDAVPAGQAAGQRRARRPSEQGRARARWLWSGTWPRLAAVVVALALWQAVVASGWRPSYVLPGPGAVLGELGREAGTVALWSAIATTMRRAVEGFAIAIVIGGAVGVVVARVRVLRTAVGSLVTGLQTMPSIAWFPLAILLFRLSERAILFVVVLGAAPAIANGVLAGVDLVPPLLLRAGRSLGARGGRLYRWVILPAALPSFLGGLKQGWAFAWRSLMAGELLVSVAHRPSLGMQLQNDRTGNDTTGLLATMLVILVLGILVDTLFGAAEGVVRRRWGFTESR